MARKILLADDSVTAQNMGRKILADAGYEVLTVNNGSAALKRIHEAKPDLIVLDVYMPGYSGLEVCQRLREAPETAHIPVLLTVGKLEPFKPEEARRVRADAHIVKPFEASELLSALARLEDRMVPDGDGTRPGGAEASTDPDTGWKSRLRFPSKKKKKEEPEAEPDESLANFRDYRKGKGRGAAAGAFGGSGKAAAQEPAVVPDIPRDITPEELDALSALAAKLDAPGPGAESVAPAAEFPPPVEAAVVSAPAVAPSEEAARGKEETVPASVVEASAETATAEAPVAELPVAKTAAAETTQEFEVPATPVEAAEPSAVAGNVVEIPVEQVEPPNDGAATDQIADSPHTEEVAALTTVNAASLVQEPSPIDRQDEPMFASTTLAATTQAAVTFASADETPEAPVMASAAASEEQAEAQLAEAVAAIEMSAPAEPPIATTEEFDAELRTAEAATAEEPQREEPQREESKESNPEESKAEEPKIEEPGAAEAAPPVVVAATPVEPVAEAEGPPPSDEELAEALRLLTPSTAQSETPMPAPTHGTLVAAGQLLAEEAARHAWAASRWVAEPVALSAEEATLSLEEEMFRTFAAAPAGEATSAPVTSCVSEIAAPVESGVTEASLAPATMTASPSEPASELVSELVSEPAAENQPADAAMTQTQAPDAVATAETTPESAQETVEEPATMATFAEALAQVAAAQFAGAQSAEVQSADVHSESQAPSGAGAGAEQREAPAGEVSAVVTADERQELSGDSGGREDMAKGRSGKSNWHQIHRPASAAKGDAVEAAKQAEPAAEDAPKAMAAAAAAESASAKAPVPDPNAIASIVDSVLADLRPKIVEEIAKKLAGK